MSLLRTKSLTRSSSLANMRMVRAGSKACSVTAAPSVMNGHRSGSASRLQSRRNAVHGVVQEAELQGVEDDFPIDGLEAEDLHKRCAHACLCVITRDGVHIRVRAPPACAQLHACKCACSTVFMYFLRREFTDKPKRKRTLKLVLLRLYHIAFVVLTPVALQFMFDKALPDKNRVLASLLIMGTAVAYGLDLVQSYWFALLFPGDKGVALQLRDQLSDHLINLPAVTFNRIDQGLVAQVLHQEALSLGAVPKAVFGVCSECCMLFFALVSLFRLEWRISLTVVFITPLMAYWAVVYSGKVQDCERVFSLTESKYNSINDENIAMCTTGKFLGILDFFASRNDDEGGRVLHRIKRLKRSASLFQVFVDAAAAGNKFFVLGFGTYLIYKDEMHVGTFVAFYSLVTRLSDSISRCTGCSGCHQSLNALWGD